MIFIALHAVYTQNYVAGVIVLIAAAFTGYEVFFVYKLSEASRRARRIELSLFDEIPLLFCKLNFTIFNRVQQLNKLMVVRKIIY